MNPCLKMALQTSLENEWNEIDDQKHQSMSVLIMILDTCRMKVHDIAAVVGISEERLWYISHKESSKDTFGARFPYFLRSDQRHT